jgi:enamine deaminase RidA (YjgF/YER057c/UK114 family)
VGSEPIEGWSGEKGFRQRYWPIPQDNQVYYGEYFPTDPPVRSMVEVSRLPKDVALDIDMTAYIGDEEGKPI